MIEQTSKSKDGKVIYGYTKLSKISVHSVRYYSFKGEQLPVDQ